MPEGYNPPLEEYLETIHELEEDGIVVIQARIAERLGHSAPTVSETIKRLKDEGYITVDGRVITMTEKGEYSAAGVVRKHRLAERLLVDIIGLSWHESHLEAARWEHVISDQVEERLNIILGNPATCPHGNPIPGSNQVEPELKALAEAETGDSVMLRRVTEQVEFHQPSLTYLGVNKFYPGTEGKVLAKTEEGDMKVEVHGQTLEISAWLAGLLYVAA